MTLKELRESLGWTQRDLANMLDCDAITVSRWERGLHKPSADYMALLEAVVGNEFAELEWLKEGKA